MLIYDNCVTSNSILDAGCLANVNCDWLLKVIDKNVR